MKIGIRFSLLLVALLLATVLWWTFFNRPSSTERAAAEKPLQTDTSRVADNPPPDQPAIPPPSMPALPDARTPPTAATSSSAAQEAVKLLLTAEAGRVFAFDIRAALETLRTAGSSGVSAREALIRSTNEVERLAGFWLSLELDGPSKEILDAALKDPSVLVPAQVGEWLFVKRDFVAWDEFMQDAASTFNPQRCEAVFSRFDTNPPYAEMPAALSMLGLGRAMPLLTAQLMDRSSAALEQARRDVRDPGISRNRREALFDMLAAAGHPDSMGFLKGLVETLDAQDPIRWRAVRYFAQQGFDEDSALFLDRQRQGNPDDPLAGLLEDGAAQIRARLTMNGLSPLAAEEQALENGIRSGKDVGTDEQLKRLGYYVERTFPRRDVVPSRVVAEAAAERLAALTNRDYFMTLLAAKADCLVWRSQEMATSKGKAL